MGGEIQLKTELISSQFFLWPSGPAEGRDQVCACWPVIGREKVAGGVIGGVKTVETWEGIR